MKRTVLAGLLALVAVALFALPGLGSQQDYPKGMLKLDYFPKKVVEFNHASHLDKAGAQCETCHHKKVDGKIVKCSTKGCHDVFDRKDKGEHSFYEMVHGRSTKPMGCVSCHRAAADKLSDRDAKKHLTGCMKSACHP